MNKKVFLIILKEHWILLVLGIASVFISYLGHQAIVTFILMVIIILQNIITDSTRKLSILTASNLNELISLVQRYFKTLDGSLKNLYEQMAENEEYKKDKTVN